MPDTRNEKLALIALGSNLGDSISLIQRAFERLQQLSPAPLRRSSLWSSEPVDCPPGSLPFVNAAVAMELVGPQTPEELLAILQRLEAEFGRMPKKVLNESRPLDLDLIAFGGETRRSESLTIPHPRAHLRRFVLAPLAEVAPDIQLPGQDKTIAQLLAALPPGDDVVRLR